MAFDRPFYGEGWRVWKNVLPFVAIAIVGEYGLTAFGELSESAGATAFPSAFIWALLAYAAHAEVLLGSSKGKNVDAVRVLIFTLITIGLFLIILVPAIAFAVYSAFQARPLEEVLIILVPGVGLATLILLSLLGTVFPAYVAKAGGGLGAAFSRGRRQYFWTFNRLLAGPAVVYALALVIAALPEFLPDTPSALLADTYVPNLVASLAILICFGLQSFAIVMTAVILSRAFLRSTQEAP